MSKDPKGSRVNGLYYIEDRVKKTIDLPGAVDTASLESFIANEIQPALDGKSTLLT